MSANPAISPSSATQSSCAEALLVNQSRTASSS
jgi:hypothetical protein